jgi:hypothetical protein
MNSGRVWVWPVMLPLTKATAANSPRALAVVSISPQSTVQRAEGGVTFQNTCQWLAPRMRAASSCSQPSSHRATACLGSGSAAEPRRLPGRIPPLRIAASRAGPKLIRQVASASAVVASCQNWLGPTAAAFDAGRVGIGLIQRAYHRLRIYPTVCRWGNKILF